MLEGMEADPSRSRQMKRSRSDVEDDVDDDDGPISKRINCLCIEAQRRSLDECQSCVHEQSVASLNNNSCFTHPAARQNDLLPNGSASDSHSNFSSPDPLQGGSSTFQPLPDPNLHMRQRPDSLASEAYSPSDQHQPAQLTFPVQESDMVYDPELGSNENPHYYTINQLLFNAHCQRLRRDGFPAGQDPSSFV